MNCNRWFAALALLGAVALILGPAAAQAQTIVGSKHDLSNTGPGVHGGTTEICVFCHTPHQATAANKQDPLWNHTLSATASYGIYASTTLNATPTDIGGAVAGSATVSNLCMSCHDGTVSVASLYNPPNSGMGAIVAGGAVTGAGLITGNPNLGTDLTDDHPVNFTFNAALATADGGLVTPASAAWVDAGSTVPLYTWTVQCASCHNVHNPTNVPFLRVANAASALCLKCHVK